MNENNIIQFHIESENGHDTLEVPLDKLPEEVNKQLVDGKWVTVEKKDGSTEIITKPIDTKKANDALKALEDDDDEEEVGGDTNANAPEKKEEKIESKAQVSETNWKDTFAATKKEDVTTEGKDWKNTFDGAKSATATNKMKGG